MDKVTETLMSCVVFPRRVLGCKVH